MDSHEKAFAATLFVGFGLALALMAAIDAQAAVFMVLFLLGAGALMATVSLLFCGLYNLFLHIFKE